MTLYPYQREGVRFLEERKRAYLADEMGLGKTVQALVALRDVPSITIVCPAAAVGNWYREFEYWGSGQQVQCVSYASLHKIDAPYHTVVLDEAHYTKSLKAKRTKRALSMARDAEKAILLSGTPMPNHPGELYTMFKYLWPELLSDHNRTEHKWLRRYTKGFASQYGWKVTGFQNAPELKALLAQVMLRRKLADVALDLPPLRVTSQVLPPEAGWTIEEAKAHGMRDILTSILEEKEQQKMEHLASVRRWLGEYKAPLIASVLDDEIKDGQYKKIVVLYHHRSVGDVLENKLRVHGLVRLDGRTPATSRQPIVDRFNNDSGVTVFLGQQTAAGEALNLQAASEIVLAEPAWTPDANRQAVKRVHRIGQDSPCRARVFSVPDSIDQAIMDAIAKKTQAQEAVGLR